MSTFYTNLNLSPEKVTQPTSTTHTCLAGSRRGIQGVVRPSTREEVIEVLRAARETKTRLYPISTGMNWGLGSMNPVQDNCVILDLSSLNRIYEINHKLGYAHIEPGVTQEQLANQLKLENSPFFLDVTGSSADTSILGNALDRGISYNLLRVDTITKLEVLLGTGEIIETGFGHYGPSELSHLYRHGVGPSLEGLFFQSNFGIVLSATVALLPRPQKITSFIIQIQNESRLPELCEALRELMMAGDLNCITHVFNQERIIPGLAPHVAEYFEKINQPKTKTEVDDLIRNEFPAKWLAAGNIKGDAKQVQILERKIKKKLSLYGKVIVLTDFTKKLLSLTQYLPGLHAKKALLYAQRPVGEMTTGQPTYGTLGALHWPIVGHLKDKHILKNPDLGKSGFIYTLPFAPLTAESARTLIEVTQTTGHKYGFEPAITLNLVTNRILEAVISLSFDRENQQESEKAKQCLAELQQLFINEKLFPYRTHIDFMNQLVDPQSTHWKLIGELKKQFDPDGIIAPGRYCP
ncbi:MAG: 4-cresol dehydrogenase [Oligoflexia bacterium]|nr:MAG: 4-cresol dehydrogenase [Oligoflexia bacterium]